LLLVIPAEPKKILVICTGNSCRSIMAEALINHMGQGRLRAWSAGSHPAGFIHPGSIETLNRHGLIQAGLTANPGMTWFHSHSISSSLSAIKPPANPARFTLVIRKSGIGAFLIRAG
jgi:hypothetical protein